MEFFTYSASKTAQSFAVTNAVKLGDKQFKMYVDALARLLVEAYNAGYYQGHRVAEKGDWE